MYEKTQLKHQGEIPVYQSDTPKLQQLIEQLDEETSRSSSLSYQLKDKVHSLNNMIPDEPTKDQKSEIASDYLEGLKNQIINLRIANNRTSDIINHLNTTL